MDTTVEVLCSTPVGVLHRGQQVYYARVNGTSGWLTATGISGNGRFIYARDSYSRSRVIDINEVTRIRTMGKR